jgi:hypothetical protein
MRWERQEVTQALLVSQQLHLLVVAQAVLMVLQLAQMAVLVVLEEVEVFLNLLDKVLAEQEQLVKEIMAGLAHLRVILVMAVGVAQVLWVARLQQII